MLLTLPSTCWTTLATLRRREIGEIKAIILIPWSFKLIWAPSWTASRFEHGAAAVVDHRGRVVDGPDTVGLIGLGDLSDQLTPLLYMYFLHNCFASLQESVRMRWPLTCCPMTSRGR
ncbi:MAG: hypothetical protein Ct9H300mP1_11740 [Planctomycetaceae bacterium]|nr:MAG: hypothetical protein Ct9H300mP1_11740 [Planctomycetaceae bacterium]